jgi:hypothetical protein
MGEAKSQVNESEISFNSPQSIQEQMQNEIKTADNNANEDLSVSKNINKVGDKISSITPMAHFGKFINSENFVTGLKKIYENAALVSLGIWNHFKVNENDPFPFEKNSHLFKFYVSVFPFLKLMSFCMIFLVIYLTVTGILKCVFKPKGKIDYSY